jgi:hypothetical protein
MVGLRAPCARSRKPRRDSLEGADGPAVHCDLVCLICEVVPFGRVQAAVLGTASKPRGFRAIGGMCSAPARGEIYLDRECGRGRRESGGGARGGVAGRWISRCRGWIRGSGLAGEGTPDGEKADGDRHADGRVGRGYWRWDGWQSGWDGGVAGRSDDARWSEHGRLGRERGLAGRDWASRRRSRRQADVEGGGVGWTRRGRALPGPVRPDPAHPHPVDSDPVHRGALAVAVGRGDPDLAADGGDGQDRTSVEDARYLTSVSDTQVPTPRRGAQRAHRAAGARVLTRAGPSRPATLVTAPAYAWLTSTTGPSSRSRVRSIAATSSPNLFVLSSRMSGVIAGITSG